jgi:hypothetical protein
MYEKLLNAVSHNEPVFFGDGVHPTMATKLAYGSIKQGEAKPIATKGSRTRMNIMGTLNLEKMDVVTKAYDTIDGDAVANYLGHLREAYPP